MPNAADRTLATWALGSIIASLGLVGVAKLGDADKSVIPRGSDLENNHALCELPDGTTGITFDNGSECRPDSAVPQQKKAIYRTCTMADGKRGFSYNDGKLCLLNAPAVGTPDTVGETPDTVPGSAIVPFQKGIFFEL